jgi:group I intron endonuclease
MKIKNNINKKTGIYCWRNKINNKRYVGQTNCKGGFTKRWRQERSYMNKNMPERLNKHICASWNKYGIENFEVIILEIIENSSKEYLTKREQYWCDFYQTTNPKFGYNKRICVDSNLGCKIEISKETIEKRNAILREKFSGEGSPSAKLTWDKVREIRKKYQEENITMKQLGNEYVVDRKTIAAIIHNKCWKDKNYINPGNLMYKSNLLYKKINI